MTSAAPYPDGTFAWTTRTLREEGDGGREEHDADCLNSREGRSAPAFGQSRLPNVSERFLVRNGRKTSGYRADAVHRYPIVKAAVATGMALVMTSSMAFALAPAGLAVTSGWHIMQGPKNSLSDPDNLLLGVSCVSPSFCAAVGNHGFGSSQRALIETMSKGKWTGTTSPGTRDPYFINFLNAVSCTSPDFCTATGWSSNAWSTEEHTLVETFSHGSWQLTPTPDTKWPMNELLGDSCTSPSWCVAVGDVGAPSAQRTLVETFSHRTWRLSSSPSTAPPYVVDFLNSVSCISERFCVAAGFAADSAASEMQTLILTFSGGTWELTPSPDTSSPLNQLFSVRCTSSTSCVAVGDAGAPGFQSTLIEVLSRGNWKIAPSPNTSSAVNQLYGSWCSSSTSCVAAGYALNAVGTEAHTLLETLDGGSWRITPSLDTGSALNELYGYSCGSPHSCYAVGVDGTVNEQQALIETTATRR
jgi:hypothetical protein